MDNQHPSPLVWFSTLTSSAAFARLPDLAEVKPEAVLPHADSCHRHLGVKRHAASRTPGGVWGWESAARKARTAGGRPGLQPGVAFPWPASREPQQ